MSSAHPHTPKEVSDSAGASDKVAMESLEQLRKENSELRATLASSREENALLNDVISTIGAPPSLRQTELGLRTRLSASRDAALGDFFVTQLSRHGERRHVVVERRAQCLLGIETDEREMQDGGAHLRSDAFSLVATPEP